MAIMNGPTSVSIKIKDKALFRNINCMNLGIEKTTDKWKSLASLIFCFVLSSVLFGFSSQRNFQMLSAGNFLMEKMKPFWFCPFFPITAVMEGGKRQEIRDCLLVSQLTLQQLISGCVAPLEKPLLLLNLSC